MSQLKTVSPIDLKVIVERPLVTYSEAEVVLDKSRQAQKKWKSLSLSEREGYILKMLAYFEKHKAVCAEEITLQMGRPSQYSEGELNGMAGRANYMISVAKSALSEIHIPIENGLKRYIQKTPVGTVLVVAPWNYPYLTAVNAIVPALLAGNAVILKHASQTPLCAERFAKAFQFAGLSEGVFQYIHMSHEVTEKLVADHRIHAVAFTGSVGGGYKIKQAAANRFIGINLELGGKDPAYVRSDVNVVETAANLVEGVFFNSGQSCCGVERIYVDASIYPSFVKAFVAETKKLILGDPRQSQTTLGPLVKVSAADFVREQIGEAIKLGAKTLISETDFNVEGFQKNYLAPQVLMDVNHQMSLMTEENFGPVVGIMSVSSDEEAIALMNDSSYGLTASIWSKDITKAERLCAEVETGTCFVNRCDYLDPALAWTGVKDTGIGCSLSVLGFDAFTRPKSIHIRA